MPDDTELLTPGPLTPEDDALQAIWPRLGEALSRQASAGKSHLLTADTFRWLLIDTLIDQGVRPDEIRVDARLLHAGPTVDLLLLLDSGVTESISIAFQPRDNPRIYTSWLRRAEVARDTPAHTRWVVAAVPRHTQGKPIPDTLNVDTRHPDPTRAGGAEFTTHCAAAIDCDYWLLIAHTIPYPAP